MRYCFAVLLLVLVGSCGDPADRSRVTLRVIHAVPDGQAVDIWYVGRRSRLFENLTFGTASGYASLEPGTYRFQVRAAGAPGSAPPLAESGDVVVGPGGREATVIFGGLVSAPVTDPPDPNALRVDVYVHGFTVESSTKAAVRFVHNATEAPTFDLTVDDDDPLPDDDSDGTYVGLEPYTASDAAGIAVDPDDPEQLLVSDNATTLGLASFTTGALQAGNEYFVVFLGSLQSPPGADDVTACDAAYLVLAATLAAPLLTCDGRLKRVPRRKLSTAQHDGLRALDVRSLPEACRRRVVDK